MTASIVPPPAFAPYGAAGYDVYGSLNKTADNATRPVEKGEFARLIGKLASDKRAQLLQAVLLFKELSNTLPHAHRTLTQDAASIKAMTDAEVEKAAKTILVALRNDQVGTPLFDAIKLQLYETLIYADEYEKAVNLYPALKTAVGGRLKGIYALSARINKVRGSVLTEYFTATTNAREGLIALLIKSSSPVFSPENLTALFHFGVLLPIHYLLTANVSFKDGTCGGGNSTTEDRIRLILGPSISTIPPGILDRMCKFAAVFV